MLNNIVIKYKKNKINKIKVENAKSCLERIPNENNLSDRSRKLMMREAE